MARSHVWTDDQLVDAVRVSYTQTQVLLALGVRATGNNYRILRRSIERLQLSTTHFTPGKAVGAKSREPLPLSQLLVKGRAVQGTMLRRRLIAEGLLESRCYGAGCEVVDSWLGSLITLHLDHINGDHSDNRLENLRLLCPNCHSQTETYCARNKPRRPENKCEDCGVVILPSSAKCKRCANERQRIDWPSVDVVARMVAESNYTQAAKVLGTTDNAIRKFLTRSGYSTGKLPELVDIPL